MQASGKPPTGSHTTTSADGKPTTSIKQANNKHKQRQS